ncbi:ribonuclease H [Indivirus ILV1]|uniref:ribonuclease H n=1 Tax=Indivirus ILV1 TaxID=1977633 RepID=A0A1V0SDD0_9VIRU|nr:ribonuclease H [Indivirus ILV1]
MSWKNDIKIKFYYKYSSRHFFMEKKSIIIFTDGACSANGKKCAKAGIGIHFPNGEFNDVSKKFTESPITNQRAELYAIQSALELVINTSLNEIIIYSDSLYSIKSLTEWVNNWEKNNWQSANNKPVKNLDLIKPIYRLLNLNKHRVKFIHVKSHTKEKTFEAVGNDKADKLACDGVLL